MFLPAQLDRLDRQLRTEGFAMSNPYPQPPVNPYLASGYGARAPQENTLGLVGFIVSLLSFVVCPLAAPIGLILSLMALRREPKGFAIAGAIVGGLITLTWVAIIALYGAILAACIGIGVAAQPQIQTRATLNDARQRIESFKGPAGDIPGEAEGNGIIQGMEDYWKHPLRYEPQPRGFVIRSAGPDGQFNTPDDLIINDWGSDIEMPKPEESTLPDSVPPDDKPLIPLPEQPAEEPAAENPASP
jgi:hypothetical protein